MQDHRQKYVDDKINRNFPAQMWVSLDTDKQNRLIKASREYYGRDRK